MTKGVGEHILGERSCLPCVLGTQGPLRLGAAQGEAQMKWARQAGPDLRGELGF